MRRRRSSSHKRLLAPENFVVLIRRNIVPRDSRNNRPLWIWQFRFAISLNSHIIRQNRADIIQAPRLVRHRHQFPIAISIRNFCYEDRRDRRSSSAGLLRRRAYVGKSAHHSNSSDQRKCRPSHTKFPLERSQNLARATHNWMQFQKCRRFFYALIGRDASRECGGTSLLPYGLRSQPRGSVCVSFPYLLNLGGIYEGPVILARTQRFFCKKNARRSIKRSIGRSSHGQFPPSSK